MASTSDLECRQISKRFKSFTAVDSISLDIPKGSFFSILGPSGCGKTTLLRMIAGFLSPDEGDILINGRSMLGVAPNKRPVNMIFQHLALFPTMSVADNIGYGLRRQNVAAAERHQRVSEALARVDLAGAEDKHTGQLSGGQQQRVAIARCMVLNPAVLLLDEPLGALDLKLREHMKVELKQLQREFGTTFLYITHDQSEALVMSNQVAVMNKGHFEQVGSPQSLYYSPATAFVAGFVGDANRWIGKLDRADKSADHVLTESGFVLGAVAALDDERIADGDQVEVFVRPEAIQLARNPDRVANFDNRLDGRIHSVLFNGGNSSILVKERQSGGEITVTLPQTGEYADLTVGDDVFFAWNAAQAKYFAHSPPT